MRSPSGAAAELESRICEGVLGPGFDLARVRKLGEGTRRVLRIWAEGLRYEGTSAPTSPTGGHGTDCIRVYFVLPKGAYATTVLRAAVELHEGEEEPDTRSEDA